MRRLLFASAAVLLLSSQAIAGDRLRTYSLTGKTNSGAVLVLNRRYVFAVSPLDRIDSTLWMTMDEIAAFKGKSVRYPYILLNVDDEESVRARFLGRL